jgi:3-deoxy-manno-octulosonate cytidylyltransferase (CMP-KDO synthetase)
LTPLWLAPTIRVVTIIKVLPFRLASSRFPDKPLCSFAGTSLLEHALIMAGGVPQGTTVVTAPEEDFREASRRLDLSRYRFRYVPTRPECRSASQRIVELSREVPGELFVSLPVDEPALMPEEISRVLEETADVDYLALTLFCDFFCLEDALSPLSAKVVLDQAGRVLYMSRAPVPVSKSGEIRLAELKKNVGVFFLRRELLDRLWQRRDQPSFLDELEGLEQLRWLDLGFTLHAMKVRHCGFGIDTPEQLGHEAPA